MQDYQQRVVEEVEHLEEKIEKLNTFVGTDKFNSLPMKEQELLFDQRNAMCAYSDILKKRIALFK